MFEKFDLSLIEKTLLPREAFKPWPVYEDAEAWEKLPDEVRRTLIQWGEERLTYDWPSLPATLYMDFQRNGNRSRYEKLYFERRYAVMDLAFAECVERRGRFLDQMINGLWLILEETSWTVPAHNIRDNFILDPLPDVNESPRDLFACETAALVSGISYMFGHVLGRISRRLGIRIREEVLRRVVRPACRELSSWSGLTDGSLPIRFPAINNWAPWCSSTTLMAVLLLGETEEIRSQYIRQILNTMEVFAAVYGEDGGCDEGPTYYGKAAGSFFDTLYLIGLATGGAISVFDLPKVKAMGEYQAKAHLSGSWFMNFADCAASFTIEPELTYLFGKAVGSERMMAFASELMPSELPTRSGSMLRRLYGIPAVAELKSYRGQAFSASRDWFPDLQVLIARQGALTFAAKGGHNDESHNHNDIGSFILFKDGEPILIDAGTLAYTKRTFSEQRYEIWTMRSSWHNLPDFGGAEQLPGREYASGGVMYTETDNGCTLDIKAGPSWGDTIRFDRSYRLTGKSLIIEDFWETENAASPCFHFLLKDLPRQTGSGWVLGPKGHELKLTLKGAAPIAFSVDTIFHKDVNMAAAWGQECLYRLNLTLPACAEGNCVWTFTSEKNR